MAKKICAECGSEFHSKQGGARYCSTACRKAFNNRRMVRGAQLYDAFMAIRYDREIAAELGCDRTFLSRMGEMFRREDVQSGKGKTWRPTRELMAELKCCVNARKVA